MDPKKSYKNEQRAEAYAQLQFPNTYYLAFRDLPAIIHKHVGGKKAIDFGCGAGRSSRFIRDLGFDVIGLDNSEEMLAKAHQIDPDGDYRLVEDGIYEHLGAGSFDYLQAIFTFDNIPGVENRQNILSGLSNLINQDGTLLLLCSTPEIYTHEWMSFTTKAFPENKLAKSGDPVRGYMRDVPDHEPVVDSIWFHEDYLNLFEKTKLNLVGTYRPLGTQYDPYEWISEMEVPPWVIYVLKK